MQDVLFETVLAMHIASGGIALAAGPAAMLARKGLARHRWTGRAYAIAMESTAVSALILACLTRSMLLLVIAVFSFFLVFSGWRALGQKRLHDGMAVGWSDWLVAAVTLVFSAGLLVFGLARHGDVTALFFGVGGGVLALREMRAFTGRVPPGSWQVRHMIGMSGAYIATVSAFAVVTLTFLPRPVAFIGPTLIGTPIIVWAAVRLTLRLAPLQPTQGARS